MAKKKKETIGIRKRAACETTFETISLKPMTEDMFYAYFKEYENDPDLYFEGQEYTPYEYSEENVAKYIQRQKDLNRVALAIMSDNEIVGEIIIKNIEKGKCATMGLALKNASYKDHGIGTEAEKLAIEYVFNELDIPTIYADAIKSNTRSQHVMEKVGFVLIREDDDFKYYRIDRDVRNRLTRIRENEKRSHIALYNSEKLYDSDSWLGKPVKTVQELAEHLEGHQGLRFLDLGCGVGRNSIYLAERFKNAACTIDCVDLLVVAIEKLLINARARGVARAISGIVSSIEDYDIKPACYDMILAVSALEHVESEKVFQKKLAEIREGVKEKGIVCLIVNSDAWEIRTDTKEPFEAQFEVNIPSDKVIEIMDQTFRGWEVMKSTVIPQEYDIPREFFVSHLHTNVVTFAARRLGATQGE